MTASTLFSGIGAPEVAMPHWRWLWHAEIEKFPSAVMAARHPESVNLGDVTAHDFVDRALAIGRPDVLVFGSPCQSFSVAGKRLGLDDPRGNLALVALGIAARLEPTWFVFENVPGLLSASDGRDFGLFLRTVDELGYHLCWTHLDAQYFGVAQRRGRLFAVGHARDWRYPAAVLLEPESLSGHPPARGEAREDVTGTPASRPSAGGGLGTDFDLGGGLVHCADVAPTLNAHFGSKQGLEDQHALNGAGLFVAFDWQSGGSKQRTRTRTRTSALSANQTPAVMAAGVRRLMPVECERLQGFPDHYTAITYRGKPAADGPRYKAIGNSMAVPVVRWILERLQFVDGVQE